MMKTFTFIFILSFNSLLLFGQNLISNPSFEIALSQLSCNSWYNRCGNELTISCDTSVYCQVGFKDESPVPSQWEAWSLKVFPGWPDEGYAETYVTGQIGTKIYQLKYWIKTPLSVAGNYIMGYGSIGMGSQTQFLIFTTHSDTAVQWKQITITDTLTTVATDTITVRLSADNCDFCIGSVYFDFVELNIIADLTSIDDPEINYNENIKVYPNPSNGNITIEINNNKNEHHRLLIYNQAGEFINTCSFNFNLLTIKKDNLASGLYYFKVQRISDRRLIGSGKFVIN